MDRRPSPGVGPRRSTRLWTTDPALATVAKELGISYEEVAYLARGENSLISERLAETDGSGCRPGELQSRWLRAPANLFL